MKSTECRICGGSTSVIDSRRVRYKGTDTIKRRRLCSRCTFRWNTYEVCETLLEELMMPKKFTSSLQ